MSGTNWRSESCQTSINGETAEHRLAVRREQSAPLLADLEDWMRTERAGLSRHSPVARAMDYIGDVQTFSDKSVQESANSGGDSPGEEQRQQAGRAGTEKVRGILSS